MMTPQTPHSPPLRHVRTRLIAIVAFIVALPALALTLVLLTDEAGADQPTAADPTVRAQSVLGPVIADLGETVDIADLDPVLNASPTERVLANACPAPGSEFIDSWGFSRSGGRRHKGVDMMAPHGTWVLAPANGWVRQHHSSLGGLSYYLTTPEGIEYYGAHLQSFIDSGIQDEFGWVTAGTLIGTVGSSGNASSSGPHLHWEVRTASGESVNPYLLAVAYCS